MWKLVSVERKMNCFCLSFLIFFCVYLLLVVCNPSEDLPRPSEFTEVDEEQRIRDAILEKRAQEVMDANVAAAEKTAEESKIASEEITYKIREVFSSTDAVTEKIIEDANKLVDELEPFDVKSLYF